MTVTVLRQFSSAPRLVAWLCLTGIAATAWLLVLRLAPGDGLGFLCLPYTPAWTLTEYGVSLVMWLAMALAMMLPSAAPMLSTYLDIQEAASAKAMIIPSAGLLGLGYGVAWLGFAVAATLLQGLVRLGGGMDWPWAAGLLLIAAGVYQFSHLKHACLTKCRQPMPYFLANWSERPHAIFRMGLQQGLFCVGCCWAMMLLALVAGFMHPVWMAAVAALAVLEKVLPQPRSLVMGTGIGLIAAGTVLLSATGEGGYAIW